VLVVVVNSKHFKLMHFSWYQVIKIFADHWLLMQTCYYGKGNFLTTVYVQ